MSSLRSDGFFTPPSLRGTLVIPGNVGGMAWGGIAHDRVNDLLIMPVNKIAAEVRLIPRDNVAAGQQAGQLSGDFEYAPQRGTPYGLVRRLLLGPKTLLPCTPPPWGILTAVKAGTGEIAWRTPLGQFPGTETAPDAREWGSIALGGPIATAGGLVFTGGTLEAAILWHEVAGARPARLSLRFTDPPLACRHVVPTMRLCSSRLPRAPHPTP
jgi:quinoprotein glucose dehydrogenase